MPFTFFEKCKWKKMTWDGDQVMKVKWKWLEIEIKKWKWNEKASRSRSEISRKLKNHSWHTLFWVPHPPQMVNFFYEIWCQISLFFLEKKGEIFFPFTLFEKWKWNRNDWKSRSRSESEIKMTQDRELKLKKKISRMETLVVHCQLSNRDCLLIPWLSFAQLYCSWCGWG